MHFTTLLPLLPLLVRSSSVPSSPRSLFANPSDGQNALRIPTSYESAVMARRILHLTPLGTLSTVFPSPSHLHDDEGSLEQRPAGLSGIPIGLMDYIADCETGGDPTILAINIATSFKNAAAGSNISLSLQWTPPHPPSSRIKSWFSSPGDAVPYSAANLPRFSLLGYLEKMEDTADLRQCFVDVHPDAKYWLPGNKIHAAEWVRLVVQDIYWVGGFGDRAYIGWIPVEEWRNVTKSEWEDIKLPGEKKGWKEWSVSGWEL
ncbi:FMN-binding split barrel-3 [Coleophoma cylindrospora]|uniref:FMN-binding split barrel-3 n=1 Tax=Coleophoma cylindrospora TaxID=1849047 RepID=A0A3D8S0V7_9HELO|nr:FMN-binding split barrel-3 [Coleophoma cylindrospora]